MNSMAVPGLYLLLRVSLIKQLESFQTKSKYVIEIILPVMEGKVMGNECMYCVAGKPA